MSLLNDIRAWRNRDNKQMLYVSQEHSTGSSLSIVMSLLKGNIPDANYDEIRRIITSDTAETFSFYFNGILAFDINITNPHGDYVATFTDYALVGLIDDSGTMGLIDGSGFVAQIGE